MRLQFVKYFWFVWNTVKFKPEFWWGRVALFLVFCVMVFCFVCLRLVLCVPNVARVSELSFLDCPFGFLYRLATYSTMFVHSIIVHDDGNNQIYSKDVHFSVNIYCFCKIKCNLLTLNPLINTHAFKASIDAHVGVIYNQICSF